MAKPKVLLDINICLDVIMVREPFAADAEQVLFAAETGAIHAYVSAISFDTIFYFAQQKYHTDKAYQALQSLRSIVEIAKVDEEPIDLALQSGWKDFEDALQHYSATQNGCEAIITRNLNDYGQSDIDVYKPFEFLTILNG